MIVDWSRVIEWGVLVVVPALLTGGIGTAIVQGRFGRPLQRALTRKEEAQANSVTADTSIELVKLWMTSNKQLVDSNERLKKSNDRLQRNLDSARGELHRELGQARREINETRHVMRALADGIERFMPLLRQIVEDAKDAKELELLNHTVAQAKSMNGGLNK